MDEESEGVAPIPDRGEVRVGPRFDVSRKARRREGDSRRRVARARWLCAPDSAAGEGWGLRGMYYDRTNTIFSVPKSRGCYIDTDIEANEPRNDRLFRSPLSPFFFPVRDVLPLLLFEDYRTGKKKDP